MRIKQALDAFLFSQRTSRGSRRTVGVRATSERSNAHRVSTANSSASLNSSPVNKRAVSIGQTFDAASTVEVTVRSTVVDTLVVGSTESDASVGHGIAVRLASDFTSIDTRSALLTGRFCSTRITTTIGTTVSSVGRAIGVLQARSASSSGSVAGRLSCNFTTIKSSAVSVGETSLASSVGLTVLSASVGKATLVTRISIASVRISADTVHQANGGRPHWERSIVGSAVGVGSTSNASSILHAI